VAAGDAFEQQSSTGQVRHLAQTRSGQRRPRLPRGRARELGHDEARRFLRASR
jgi:hypothetical protein